jgi:hypothetical protein
MLWKMEKMEPAIMIGSSFIIPPEMVLRIAFCENLLANGTSVDSIQFINLFIVFLLCFYFFELAFYNEIIEKRRNVFAFKKRGAPVKKEARFSDFENHASWR